MSQPNSFQNNCGSQNRPYNPYHWPPHHIRHPNCFPRRRLPPEQLATGLNGALGDAILGEIAGAVRNGGLLRMLTGQLDDGNDQPQPAPRLDSPQVSEAGQNRSLTPTQHLPSQAITAPIHIDQAAPVSRGSAPQRSTLGPQPSDSDWRDTDMSFGGTSEQSSEAANHMPGATNQIQRLSLEDQRTGGGNTSRGEGDVSGTTADLKGNPQESELEGQ